MAEQQLVDARGRPVASEAPVIEELADASGGRDITRGFIDGLELLQPQDSIIVGRGGGDYKIYEELLRDDQVQSTFQQRRLAVVGREYGIKAGGESALDKRAADFATEVLQQIKFDRSTDKMLFGLFYGFAAGECMWGRDGSLVTLERIKVRKQRRFRFGVKGELRLLTTASPQGEVMPDRKFWQFSCGADNDDDPYGMGLGHYLYWPVYFKRNGLKFWLIFLEKYGVPTALATYPRNSTPEQKRTLLAAASAIQTDAAIAIPEGTVLRLLEAQRSGNIDQRTFISEMNSAISKIVLSQTMTTDNGSSHAQAGVHNDVRKEVVKSDADLLCESFNEGPLRWLTEWNFPGAMPPKVWRNLESAPDTGELADRDRKIVEMGFEPSEQYVNETYGGQWRRTKAAAPIGNLPVEPGAEDFAEGAPSPTALLADRAENDAAEIFTGLFQPIQKLVEGASSFAELRDGIIDLYSTMTTDKLGSLIQRAGVAAELAGRFEVQSEGEEEEP